MKLRNFRVQRDTILGPMRFFIDDREVTPDVYEREAELEQIERDWQADTSPSEYQ